MREYDPSEDPARVQFPFGKFKGEVVADVPSNYLLWCIEQHDNLRPWLRRMIQRVLAERIGFSAAPPQQYTVALPSPEIAAAAGEMVALGYRALALKAHPDRGGDHAAMIVATDARDWLRGMVGAF